MNELEWNVHGLNNKYWTSAYPIKYKFSYWNNFQFSKLTARDDFLMRYVPLAYTSSILYIRISFPICIQTNRARAHHRLYAMVSANYYIYWWEKINFIWKITLCCWCARACVLPRSRSIHLRTHVVHIALLYLKLNIYIRYVVNKKKRHNHPCAQYLYPISLRNRSYTI